MTRHLQLGGGGLPKGHTLPRDPAGLRHFTLLLTPEIKSLINLPESATNQSVGLFRTRKPIEAASRAYTMLCRFIRSGQEACVPNVITIQDLYATTKKGPKVYQYLITSRANLSRSKTAHYSDGRQVEYPWSYQIVPIKNKQLETALAIHEQHRSVARTRYSKLAKKPSRY